MDMFRVWHRLKEEAALHSERTHYRMRRAEARAIVLRISMEEQIGSLPGDVVRYLTSELLAHSLKFSKRSVPFKLFRRRSS